MRRVFLASLAVAASLAVPAATATAAGSGWSKPATLVPAGTLAYQPTMATAANGTTIIVWDQFDAAKNTYSLMAATRTPQGKISTRKLGPAANATAKPAVAVGGDGTFAVAWEYPGPGAGHGTLAVRIMSAGKTAFGPTSKVSPADMSTEYGLGDAPSIAVDDAGTVYVVWEGVSGRTEVFEASRTKGARAWSKPARLSAGGVDSHGARLAAAGNGHAAVTWSETNSSVWASIAAAGRFGAAKRISAVSYESSPSSIAMSGAGKAALLWEQIVKGTTHRIAAKVTASRVFPAATRYLSGKNFSRFPALALASNGSGTGAWEAEVAGGWEIDAATLSGSSWGRATKLDRTGYAATFGVVPVVAANNQRAVVAWSEKDLHRASYVGVRVRVGKSWQAAADFPGISAPVVSVPSDPASAGPVAGVMVWFSTSGLQISVLK